MKSTQIWNAQENVNDRKEAGLQELVRLAPQMNEFHAIKSRICYKLVNAKRNAPLLERVPSRAYHDLAVLYYVLIAQSEDQTATIAIHNDFMKRWGVTEETLFQLAAQNTPRLLGCCIKPIETVLEGLIGNVMGEEFPFEEMCPETVPLYVASNAQNQNGAAVLLNTNTLDAFSEQIGEGFYILPSSIHELLFIKSQSYFSADTLLEMVREINREQVAPAEVLSDNIYYYNEATGLVEMVD